MNLANTKFTKGITKNFGMIAGFCTKNSPTILTGVAIASAFAAVAFAIKGTKPALGHLHEEKRKHLERILITNGDQGVTEEEKEEFIEQVPLKPTEVIAAVWKDYVPVAILLAGTTACCIGARSIDAKRIAAMTALYQLSESTLKDFQQQTEKAVGAKKMGEIRDAINEEEVKRNPIVPENVTGSGVHLCFEPMTGRYFKSDAQTLRSIINDLNSRMINCDERISQNEYFLEIGLDGVSGGDDIGWNVDSLLEPHFTSSLMSDGTPVLVVGLTNRPYTWFQDC